jgi:hypothetical protein
VTRTPARACRSLTTPPLVPELSGNEAVQSYVRERFSPELASAAAEVPPKVPIPQEQSHTLALKTEKILASGKNGNKLLVPKTGTSGVRSSAAGPWASNRRQELLTMLDQLATSLKTLDQTVAQQAEQNPSAMLLMTHPGAGPVTSLAFVLTLGPVERFAHSR